MKAITTFFVLSSISFTSFALTGNQDDACRWALKKAAQSVVDYNSGTYGFLAQSPYGGGDKMTYKQISVEIKPVQNGEEKIYLFEVSALRSKDGNSRNYKLGKYEVTAISRQGQGCFIKSLQMVETP